MNNEVKHLYESLIGAWNRGDARGMAALYAPKGNQVGFDGSIANSPAEIEKHLTPIFADHPVATFVTKIREVRTLGPGAAILRAVAGMIPPGKTDIMPERNAIQTLIASVGPDQRWLVEMFHNTPAKFDGRPEESDKLTAELRAQLITNDRTQ
jgi:uncharacterized protein (TIGR02246 family)